MTRATVSERCPTCGGVIHAIRPAAETRIARAMVEKRAADKLSLRLAAERAGVSAATFSRVERGKTADMESAVKIAAWLGQSLDALFLPRAAARPKVAGAKRRQKESTR